MVTPLSENHVIAASRSLIVDAHAKYSSTPGAMSLMVSATAMPWSPPAG